jgi:hypothetical protein
VWVAAVCYVHGLSIELECWRLPSREAVDAAAAVAVGFAATLYGIALWLLWYKQESWDAGGHEAEKQLLLQFV